MKESTPLRSYSISPTRSDLESLEFIKTLIKHMKNTNDRLPETYDFWWSKKGCAWNYAMTIFALLTRKNASLSDGLRKIHMLGYPDKLFLMINQDYKWSLRHDGFLAKWEYTNYLKKDDTEILNRIDYILPTLIADTTKHQCEIYISLSHHYDQIQSDCITISTLLQDLSQLFRHSAFWICKSQFVHEMIEHRSDPNIDKRWMVYYTVTINHDWLSIKIYSKDENKEIYRLTATDTKKIAQIIRAIWTIHRNASTPWEKLMDLFKRV